MGSGWSKTFPGWEFCCCNCGGIPELSEKARSLSRSAELLEGWNWICILPQNRIHVEPQRIVGETEFAPLRPMSERVRHAADDRHRLQRDAVQHLPRFGKRNAAPEQQPQPPDASAEDGDVKVPRAGKGSGKRRIAVDQFDRPPRFQAALRSERREARLPGFDRAP